MTRKALGKRVRRARLREGYTQETLAGEIRRRWPTYKTTGSIISRVEAGLIETSAETLAALSVVLDEPLEDLAPEYVDTALDLRTVFDLACAPWELNPQPAESEAAPVQLAFGLVAA